MRTSIRTACVFGLTGICCSVASADIISIHGASEHSTEGLGHFTGSIEYNYQSGNQGQLIVNLSNTSEPSLGGFITGFVFNIAEPQHTGSETATLVNSSHSSIRGIGGSNINAAPFGAFDAGAAIGANFLGGGNPSHGIAVGDMGTFEFLVSSSYANALTASSFIDGPNEFNFVVRFRGLANGGSDKVPVPAPGSLALMASASLVIGAGRRRRP